ncbi:MAG: hypothetical protein VB053_05635 [Oscillibacter ruminantium]|uniref:hypothetical protein n=1 Tax=Oscillibacter ruminantium TaxID=1263547 RepID=UPI002B21FB5C|nr:hypothetical protein [Oscillibacter ruminantium]MEA5042007.1 hypothetical protein [Oscillibacter ruminantium]
MITIFNRRELITLASAQKYYHVREALTATGIPSAVKVRGAARAAERARYGIAGAQTDTMYTYTIYVHRDDYERAASAMQTALRNS